MNEPAIDVREEILEECRGAAELADALIQDYARTSIVRELARNIRKRIASIEENCGVEKYDLYFNGQVGVGKSTAICHLIGLIDRSCIEKGKEFTDMPLLKTASGRTTVCETRIIPVEGQSRIVLTKLPDEEFQVYVNEFCDKIYKPETELPSEIIRVISNMSGYPREGGKLNTKESDIIDYLKQSNAESLACTKENLIDAVSRNINYGQRGLTEIMFEEGTGRFEDWLKGSLARINDGKIPEAPFPAQISIYVSRKDKELDIPGYISSIVDTRGIDVDAGWGREDIIDSMGEKNTISIMCDGILSFGAEEKIHRLLKHIRSSGGKDGFHRIFLLGLEKGNEIKKANDAEGDYEKGVDSKKNEAQQKMEESGIPIRKTHIDCLNALSGIRYDSVDSIVISADETAYQQAREKFWNWLKTERKGMYETFYAETKELVHSLKCLSKNQFPESIIPKFSEYRRLVESPQTAQGKPWTDFQGELGHEMRSCHAGVVRGCVNRSGSYERLDLYVESSLAGGRAFAEQCEIRKEILLARLKDIFDPKDEIQKICLSAVEREIEEKYSKYYDASCEHYRACVYGSIGDNPIWYELSGYWGRGTGRYREEVIEGIIGELEKQDIAAKLAEKDFCANYMESIGKILDVYR